jgi:hypothetical protein
MTAKTTIPAEQSMRLISFKKKWGDLRCKTLLQPFVGGKIIEIQLKQ